MIDIKSKRLKTIDHGSHRKREIPQRFFFEIPRRREIPQREIVTKIILLIIFIGPTIDKHETLPN